jgi:glycosyltransferase involved in cell wall biosynthesis
MDDHSSDETGAVARRLGLVVETHPKSRGYGGNQKTCYAKALEHGADVVVMLHLDFQYTPLLVTPLATMIAYGVYDVALGSRILGGGALRGGMPLYKYVANRFLTLFQNLLTGAKLSQYHTGFRAFSKELLLSLPLDNNSFLTTNLLRRHCCEERASVRFLALPSTSPKRRLLISGVARFTDSGTQNFAGVSFGKMGNTPRFVFAVHDLTGCEAPGVVIISNQDLSSRLVSPGHRC